MGRGVLRQGRGGIREKNVRFYGIELEGRYRMRCIGGIQEQGDLRQGLVLQRGVYGRTDASCSRRITANKSSQQAVCSKSNPCLSMPYRVAFCAPVL